MNIKELIEYKKKEKLKNERRKLAKKVAAGTAVGIAAGIVGGILLAPNSGKETRDKIAQKAKEVGNDIKNRTSEAKELFDSKIAATKENVNEAKEKISQYLKDKKASKINNSDNIDQKVQENTSDDVTKG